MSFYKINKLVRDKFVENCLKSDTKAFCKVKTSDSFYEKALRKKLLEEAKEVFLEYDKENLKEEIADLLEVIECITSFYELKMEDILEKKNLKKEVKGSFKDRVFCNKVLIEDNNNKYWANYIKNKYKKDEKK